MAGFRTFLKSGHAPTLFAAFLYFDFCFAVWVLNGAMAPFISEAYQLSADGRTLTIRARNQGGRFDMPAIARVYTRYDGE
jgi:nitrate/nitrite transporter NarK